MSVFDYNREKSLKVTSSNDSGAQFRKAQPVLISSGGEDAYDISSATFSQSINSQSSGPTGIAWNDDGTKLYEIGANQNTIYEYSVSTAFDISTATFSQSIGSEDGIPHGLAWNNDGTKLYELGGSSSEIIEYSVSTAFDISTATVSQSINTQDSQPIGMAWNNDGTKLYEVGFNGNIYEYNVSAAFDISTATFSQSISTQNDTPRGLSWNNDGTKLYEVGSVPDEIYEYSVSTAFDISTATFSQNISTQDDTPQGMAWDNNGTKLYEVGSSSDKIYEYDVAVGESKTGTGDVIIDFTNISDAQKTDGFEDGDFSSNPTWTEQSTQGTAQVQSTTVKNGSNALKINTDNGVQSIQHDRDSSDSINDGDTYEAWIRTDTSSDDSQYSLTNSSNDPRGNDAVLVRFNLLGNINIQTYDSSGSQLQNQDIVQYSTNTWYKVQLTFNPSGSSVDVEVFDVDGNSLGSLTGVSTSGASNLQYTLLNKSNLSDGSFFVDDVSFSATKKDGVKDIAVYDQNNNLLDYEIEQLDTASGTGVIWVYNDWVRDDTKQVKIVYGNNDANTDRQNVTATWPNDAVLVQHLNESSSPFKDSTGYDNDSTSIEGSPADVEGVFGRALDFNGDGIEISNSSSLNIDSSGNFTLVFWVNPDTITDDALLVSKTPDTFPNEGWLTILNDGAGGSELEYYTRDGGDFIDLQKFEPLNTGEWSQVAAVTGSEGLDAAVDSNNFSPEGSSTIPTNSSPFRIADSATNSSDFNGSIDEVRFYNSSKDAAWVQADYDAAPKAGQIFFEQEAAQATTTYSEKFGLADEVSLSKTAFQSLSEEIGVSASVSVDTEQLSGTITLTDTPVQGAEVYVIRESDQKFIGYDTTNSNGEYKIFVGSENLGETLLVAADYFNGSSYFGGEKSVVFQ